MSTKALALLCERFPEAIRSHHDFRGDETAVVESASLLSVARFLKEEPSLCFNMLMDLTAVDYLGVTAHQGPRFEVVYHFFSLSQKHRLRIKVGISDEKPELDSLCTLWPIANWLEREVWDLYGIRFHGHPDLRRILLYEAFVGHPLRKDYPKEKRQPLVRRSAQEIASLDAERASDRKSILEEP